MSDFKKKAKIIEELLLRKSNTSKGSTPERIQVPPANTPRPVTPQSQMRSVQNMYAGRPYDVLGKTMPAVGSSKAITPSQPVAPNMQSSKAGESFNHYFALSPKNVARTLDKTHDVGKAALGIIPEVAGGVAGAAGGLVGGMLTALLESHRQLIKNPVGYFSGGADLKKLWGETVEGAKRTAKLGYDAGKHGTETFPLIYTKAIIPLILYSSANGIGKSFTEIGKTYEEAKQSGSKNPQLLATYNGLKEGSSQGWQLLGIDQKTAEKISENDIMGGVGNLFLYGSAYLGARGTAHLTQQGVSNLPIIKARPTGNVVYIPADRVVRQMLMAKLGKSKMYKVTEVSDGVEIYSPYFKLTPEQIRLAVSKTPYIKGNFAFEEMNRTAFGRATGPLGQIGQQKAARVTYLPEQAPIASPKGPGASAVATTPKQLPGVNNRLLPTGEGVKVGATPVDSPLAGFQMMNPAKQKALFKAQAVLQKAIEARRELIDSGKATPEVKKQFNELTRAIEKINTDIAGLRQEAIQASGPVVEPGRAAAPPATAPTTPVRTTPLPPAARSPEPGIAYSKNTKAEILDNINKLKGVISEKIYKGALAIVAQNKAPIFRVDKARNITGVTAGPVIKGTKAVPAPIVKPPIKVSGPVVQPGQHRITPVSTSEKTPENNKQLFYDELSKKYKVTYKSESGAAPVGNTFDFGNGVKIEMTSSPLERVGNYKRLTFMEGNAPYRVITMISSATKNKGNATKALNEFLKLADKYKIEIRIEPAKFGKDKDAMSTEQLIEWYKKFGFEKMGGEKNLGLMVRKPTKPKKPVVGVKAETLPDQKLKAVPSQRVYSKKPGAKVKGELVEYIEKENLMGSDQGLAKEKFGAFPFTVQEFNPKTVAALKKIINDSGQTRKLVSGRFGDTSKTASIPNPEAIRRLILFFTKKGDNVFDPFAGGGARGLMAEALGRNYFGYELRKIEVDRIDEMKEVLKLYPQIVVGDSTKVRLPENAYDLAITSPPFWKVERYSESPNDLSNIKDYDIFLSELKKAIQNTYHTLKPGGKAIFMVSSFVDKSGKLYDFEYDIKKLGLDVGFNSLYNITFKDATNQAVLRVGNFAGRNAIKNSEVAVIFEKPVKTKARPTGAKVAGTRPAAVATEKPLSRRALAAEKRAARLESKAVEEARLKAVAEVRAKNEAKAKSYQEHLAKARLKHNEPFRLKDEAASQASIANAQKDVKAYMLERKIQKDLKSGKINSVEAAKARAEGKYNTKTDKIDFTKKGTSIHDAEKMPDIDKTDDGFKLHQLGYRLVKKYQGLVGKTGAAVSEKHLPRGAAGTADIVTGSARFESLGAIGSVVHEVTHIIDRGTKFNDKITDIGTKSKLNQIYQKYYLNAKADALPSETIVEGLATFIERYSLKPRETRNEFPYLYEVFLEKDGRYYNPLIIGLVKDVQTGIGNYQLKDAIDKFEVSDMKLENKPGKYHTTGTRIETALFDARFPLERISKNLGIYRTVIDTKMWAETHRTVPRILAHNIFSKQGRFSNETYLALNIMGDFNAAYEYNWGTILRSLDTEANIKKYGSYLFARDTHFNYLELADLLKTQKANKAKIDELKAEFESTGNKDVANKIKQLKKVNEVLNGYSDSKAAMLLKRDKPAALAEEAYNLGKDVYSKEDVMFDALVGKSLDTLHLARLIEPELYNYLKGRKGYAPAFVDYIDEIMGRPEVTDMLLGETIYTSGNKRIKSLMARVGSKKAIVHPMLQAIINDGTNLARAVQQMTYNVFAESAEKLPDFVAKEIPYNPLTAIKKNVITVIDKNFKKHLYEVDKDLTAVFDLTFNPKTMELFNKLLVKGGKQFVVGTTGHFMPFMLANMPLDAISLFIQSRNATIPIIDTMIQAVKLFRKDPTVTKYLNEYIDQVGLSNTMIGSVIYAESIGDVLKIIKTGRKAGLLGGVEKGLDYASFALSFLSQMSEFMFRATEYIKSREGGNPQIVAREDAVMGTGSFAHRGTKYSRPYIQPSVYVNAGLQITQLTMRTMGRVADQLRGRREPGDKTNVAARFGIVTLALTTVALYEIGKLFYALDNAETDDEKDKATRAIVEYNNLSTYERVNYLRSSAFADKPGIMRVPNSYAMIPNLLAMVLTDRLLKTNFTKNEYAKFFIESIPLRLGPTNFIPHVIKQPFLTALGWKDFPELKRLEQDYMKYLPPTERYYSSTHPFAKKLGESPIVELLNKGLSSDMKISPIKIEAFMNMFGRAYLRQFFGEWSSDNNFITNVLTSVGSSFKGAIKGRDFLFIGREFENFYNKMNELTSGVKADSKKYVAIQDEENAGKFKTKTLESALLLDTYNTVNENIANLRKINNNNIDIPEKYVNKIYEAVSELNRGDTNKVNAIIKALYEDKEYTNFISNSLRLIEEQIREGIIEDFKNDKSKLNFLGIKTASAAMVPRPNDKMGVSERVLWGVKAPTLLQTVRSQLGGYVNLTDKAGRVLYTFDTKEKPVDRASIYHPLNPAETHENPDGVGSAGVKLKFGDVAVGDRSINTAVKAAAKDGKFLYIYVKELKDIKTPYGYGLFRVLDTMNIRYDKMRAFDFVSDVLDGTWSYPKTKMERQLVKAKTIQYIVK
jgi:hypothetical protein